MKRIVTLDDKMDIALVEFAKQRNLSISTAIRLALKELLERETGVQLEAQLSIGGNRRDIEQK